MRYYTALVHHDEGSAYGLTFPDLPGAFAAADTWDDIPAAAAEALDLWFEDQPDVAGASIDDIRARPDVAEELAAGASLMPVPYIPADTATERVNVTLERSLLRAIDETAKARKMTRSSFLASAARRELSGVGA
ncbi:CopG family transcriptional regulator [Pseudooceanicola antarcticus]|uniref:CopG family transcriptional regulator n=2 Tax=Pseudooceanicola antarcticus TaxID=1247613 RepID=A0ABX4MIA3_9RHOB|nr:type II toxin-antitoxin system HicB family antitoxin [Pseudooceanicola antarcticus]PJE25638.1 CopG family transcriptional regulator [Pseudooceanicola antarcticus]PJE26552.1 CopG family transcriptional regulator [Pseudooceanicola antarcticus]PJE26803.1 CopG family transcriptional regulator [Pseudooceanicola antarcticus]PJE29979.1 CopG family transcriptional regulator [Pseudooceanicola antarcticus]